MNPACKITLLLLLSLVNTLSAETEKEFVTRVTSAWQSNDPTKVLALYGASLKEGSELHKVKAQKIEMDLKTRSLTNAQLVPFGPVEEGPSIVPGKIVFMPNTSQFLAMETTSKDAKFTGTITTFLPVVKNNDDTFSLGVPTVTPFEWNGPQMEGFDIKLEATASTPLPPVIIVYETCGYVSFMKMEGPVAFLSAHKIQQLILPPIKGGGTVNIAISKRNQEPYFKKTVDGTKGALIPIEPATP